MPLLSSQERDACGIDFVADVHGRATRAMVDTGLEALRCLRHRGSLSADAKTGDGAGLLLPIAPRFVSRIATEAGAGGTPAHDIGVAMAFLSRDPG